MRTQLVTFCLGLTLTVGCSAPSTPAAGQLPVVPVATSVVTVVSANATPTAAPAVTPPTPTTLASPIAVTTAAATVAATAVGSPTAAVTSVASPTPLVTSTTTPMIEQAPASSTPRPPSAEQLFLRVTEPAAETVEVPSATEHIVVAGETLRSAVVSVNGILVVPDGTGVFQAEVPLDDEITVIEVLASDATGTQLRLQRVVVRE